MRPLSGTVADTGHVFLYSQGFCMADSREVTVFPEVIEFTVPKSVSLTSGFSDSFNY